MQSPSRRHARRGNPAPAYGAEWDAAASAAGNVFIAYAPDEDVSDTAAFNRVAELEAGLVAATQYPLHGPGYLPGLLAAAGQLAAYELLDAPAGSPHWAVVDPGHRLLWVRRPQSAGIRKRRPFPWIPDSSMRLFHRDTRHWMGDWRVHRVGFTAPRTAATGYVVLAPPLPSLGTW